MVVFSLIAVASLFTAVAFVPVIGGILVSALALGVFFLALVGVLGNLEDRSVRQHDPKMDPTGWRQGA